MYEAVTVYKEEKKKKLLKRFLLHVKKVVTVSWHCFIYHIITIRSSNVRRFHYRLSNITTMIDWYALPCDDLLWQKLLPWKEKKENYVIIVSRYLQKSNGIFSHSATGTVFSESRIFAVFIIQFIRKSDMSARHIFLEMV